MTYSEQHLKEAGEILTKLDTDDFSEVINRMGTVTRTATHTEKK